MQESSNPEREAELKLALTPENIIKAARYVFARYCEAKKIQEHQKSKLDVRDFVQWMGDNSTGYVPSEETVAREAGVPLLAAEFILSQGHKTTGVAQIYQLWSYLVLEKRKTEHEVLCVQLMLVVQWTDGTTCPLIQLAHKDTNPDPIRDAEVMQLIASYSPRLAQTVLDNSLDGLHDNHANIKNLGSPDTLTKITLACQDAMALNKLTASDMESIGRLITYVGTLFPRALPPHIKQRLDMEQAAKTAGRPVVKTSRPASAGWDA